VLVNEALEAQQVAGANAAGAYQSDRYKPKFRNSGAGFHMDVGWLGAFVAVEEESPRSVTQDGRHFRMPIGGDWRSVDVGCLQGEVAMPRKRQEMSRGYYTGTGRGSDPWTENGPQRPLQLRIPELKPLLEQALRQHPVTH
jgi:hypothetical protein